MSQEVSQAWYYCRAGNRQGRVAASELKQLASSDQLSPDDLVWKQGLPDWVQARTVKGLFPAAPPPSVPPPLPAAPQAAASLPAAPSPAAPSPPAPPAAAQQPMMQDIVGQIRTFVSSLHKQRMGVGIAALCGALATFLPWVQGPVHSLSGAAGIDGWISLALFVPAIVLAVRGNRAEPLVGHLRLGAVIPAGISSLMAFYKIVEFNTSMSGISSDNPFGGLLAMSVRPGIGLYVIVLAGIAIGALAWALTGRPQAR